MRIIHGDQIAFACYIRVSSSSLQQYCYQRDRRVFLQSDWRLFWDTHLGSGENGMVCNLIYTWPRAYRFALTPVISKNIRVGRWSVAHPTWLSLTPCTANTLLARLIPTVIMLMDFPFRGVDEMSEIPSWLLLPFAETSPQPRYGEVPFIRLTRF